MPTPTAKPADKPAVKPVITPADRQLNNLKHLERKAVEKLKRIETWPAEHQKAAKDRTEENLSQIRLRMKKLAT